MMMTTRTGVDDSVFEEETHSPSVAVLKTSDMLIRHLIFRHLLFRGRCHGNHVNEFVLLP